MKYWLQYWLPEMDIKILVKISLSVCQIQFVCLYLCLFKRHATNELVLEAIFDVLLIALLKYVEYVYCCSRFTEGLALIP